MFARNPLSTRVRRRKQSRIIAAEVFETRTLLSASVMNKLEKLGVDIHDQAIQNLSRNELKQMQRDLQRQARHNHNPSPNPTPQTPTEFRSIDGTGNNLTHSQIGSTGEQLLRVASNDYGDGVSSPAGENRPSAREISNELAAQMSSLTNNRDLSSFVFAWGQFLDHDLDLTEAAGTEAFNIEVPDGDPQFDPQGSGTQTIALTRSHFDESTGTDANNPRQQINQITSWVDGSNVYGSSDEVANSLRSFQGGKLRIGVDGLLPLDDAGMFEAGDIRANENIQLTSMHTLFVREHNRQADRIAAENPHLTDEEIYQQARAVVVAQIQAITYNEFLPALLGQNAIPKYRGYDSSIDPSIANEFSTAAFRFGHTTLKEEIGFYDNNGLEVRDSVQLRDAFFNPSLLSQTGIDSVLKFIASNTANEFDTQVIDSVRNFLFGQPGQGGFDLVSLNIQRGRDHGLADYNSTREAYGLPKVQTFADITSNVELQQKLEGLYGSVDDIDLWIGGLAEDHAQGSSLGETFQTIIADQFQRLRDADRFWYQNTFSGNALRQIENTKLSYIIEQNTSISQLQENVFLFTGNVGGQVFQDNNHDGRLSRKEQGVRNVQIELLDADGTVLGTTLTDRNGRYRFSNIDQTGEYEIRVVTNNHTTTPQSFDVLIDRGGLSLSNLNFGIEVSRRGRDR